MRPASIPSFASARRFANRETLRYLSSRVTPHPVSKLLVGPFARRESKHFVHGLGAFEHELHAVELQKRTHRSPRNPFVPVDERMVMRDRNSVHRSYHDSVGA